MKIYSSTISHFHFQHPPHTESKQQHAQHEPQHAQNHHLADCQHFQLATIHSYWTKDAYRPNTEVLLSKGVCMKCVFVRPNNLRPSSVSCKRVHDKLGMVEHCLFDVTAFWHFYFYNVFCDDVPVMKEWWHDESEISYGLWRVCRWLASWRLPCFFQNSDLFLVCRSLSQSYSVLGCVDGCWTQCMVRETVFVWTVCLKVSFIFYGVWLGLDDRT